MFLLCVSEQGCVQWAHVCITNDAHFTLSPVLNLTTAYRFASHAEALQAATTMGLTAHRFRVAQLFGRS